MTWPEARRHRAADPSANANVSVNEISILDSDVRSQPPSGALYEIVQ